MPFAPPITSLEDPIDLPEEDPQATRLALFRVAILLGMLLLVIQLWRLQIVEGPQYRLRADHNRFRQMPIDAPRGVIYDRNEVLLVSNKPSYTVGIIPADLPAEPDLVFQRLGAALKMPPAEVARKVSESRTDHFSLVPIRTNVDEDLAFIIEERNRDLSGVHVVVQPIRDYLDGSTTSHILGYVGPITREQYELLRDDETHDYRLNDRIGQVGLESSFERQLRGQPGQRRMEVDVAGREVRTLSVDSPTPGLNLVLSLDLELQRLVTDLLLEGVDHYQSASAIVIDPNNGQILSLVHLPSYDNNVFSRGISQEELEALMADPHRPLLNGAIGATYSPGALFKLITAAGSLQEGAISPHSTFDCEGHLIVPSRLDPTIGIRFADAQAHGEQNLLSALVNDCKIFFYLAGGGDPEGKSDGLGIERLIHYARMFGLGERTGVHLDGEARGFVPSPEWKRENHGETWYKGDTYLTATGESYLLVTPMQIATLFATIANGGSLYRPQLVLALADDMGSVIEDLGVETLHDLPVSPGIFQEIRQALVESASALPRSARGTGSDSVASPEVSVAGQAVTVQSGSLDAEGMAHTHGWFASFAPAEDPQVVVVVFLLQGTGAKDAAPIGETIIQYYFESQTEGE